MKKLTQAEDRLFDQLAAKEALETITDQELAKLESLSRRRIRHAPRLPRKVLLMRERDHRRIMRLIKSARRSQSPV